MTNHINVRDFLKLKLNYLASSLGSLLIYRDGCLTSSWRAFDPLQAGFCPAGFCPDPGIALTMRHHTVVPYIHKRVNGISQGDGTPRGGLLIIVQDKTRLWFLPLATNSTVSGLGKYYVGPVGR